MLLQLSVCYDTITEESAEQGDVAESGYEREPTLVSVRKAIEELRRCSAVSTCPIRSAAECTGYEWALTEYELNSQDGSERQETVHLRRANGSRLSGHQLYRLFKAAKLV